MSRQIRAPLDVVDPARRNARRASGEMALWVGVPLPVGCCHQALRSPVATPTHRPPPALGCTALMPEPANGFLATAGYPGQGRE